YGASYHIGNAEEEIVTYTAAVFEYEPYNIWDDEDKGYGVMQKNVEEVNSAIRTAKLKGADIFVIPEYGLTSVTTYGKKNFTKFYTYTTYFPNPSDLIVPCDSSETNQNIEALKNMSCTAREESIYLVLNMLEARPCSPNTIASAPWLEYDTYEVDDNCPTTGFYFHNAQVVLDRTGALIVRYRKEHLYTPNENYLNPGPMNDYTAHFISDFNVPFAVQICFDIGYEDPAYNYVKNYGVKDVIMSTAWVDYLPFTIADTTQNAWSRGLKINFFIAGYHDPEGAKLGSGIYRQLFDLPPLYTFDKDSGNVLLIAEINTTISSSNSPRVAKPLKDRDVRVREEVIYLGGKDEGRTHLIYYENLQNYSSVTLERGESGQDLTADVCHSDDFCCSLVYQYTGNLTYKLISFKGQFYVSIDHLLGVQNCAILWCETDDINTCAYVDNGLPNDDQFGPFTLSTSSYTIDSIYPGSTHRNLSLISNDLIVYNVNGETYSLSSSVPVENLLSSYMFGRWYSHDTDLR
ncbi:Pantetheinase, partial [Armadillidium nasatum]